MSKSGLKSGELVLVVSDDRLALDGSTGIYVRARSEAMEWGEHDIAELKAPSLLAYLRSRGGSNPLAEDIVMTLLGHARADYERLM